MISLCLPSRGRPELFKRMCLSVLDNASNPSDIEFVTYRDNDDDSVYEYFGNHKEVVGERIFQSAMFDECRKIATGPIYMFAVDDVVFFTKDWDKYVREAFDKSNDKIIFVYPNDKWCRSNRGQVGFLHKNWVDTVGYLMPPYFTAGWADRWVYEVASMINKKIYLGPVVVIHLGPDLEGFKERVRQKGHAFALENDNHTEDKAHAEYYERWEKGDTTGVYYSKEVEREIDAKKLQNFIDHFKTT